MENNFTEDLKRKAREVGFASVGITQPSLLQDLPHGWIGQVRRLQSPEEEFPSVKSIIVMAFRLWDKIFNINVTAPQGVDSGNASPNDPFEGYFLANEIMKNKAWQVIRYLGSNGYDAIFSIGIPLKPIAVQCGLGYQGKNTLLITPECGPRVNLIAILTDAELDYDAPFQEDLCGDCDKCLRACPAKALTPYKCTINRCIVYSLECPNAPEVSEDVQHLERQLTPRPTTHSYIECSICMDVCPHGKPPADSSAP